MIECPVDHGTPQPDNESEKHSQFYTFDLEKEGGTITAFIDGEKRDFVINKHFPNLDAGGKVVLALLAKTGFFDGILYNQTTHERIESNIFVFFEKMQRETFTNITTNSTDPLSLLKALNPDVSFTTVDKFLIDDEFISEIFFVVANKIDPEGSNLDPFNIINSKILNGDLQNWQSVYTFWNKYIDAKKKLFNIVRHYFKTSKQDQVINQQAIKEIVKPKILKLFETTFNLPYMLLDDSQVANLTLLLDSEIDNGISFLIEHMGLLGNLDLHFKYQYIQQFGPTAAMEPLLQMDPMPTFHLYPSTLIFPGYLYFGVPKGTLSHCPVRRMLVTEA